MMESPMTRNCHVGFGERYEETHQSQDWKVRFVPTLLSPLLGNVALHGMENMLMEFAKTLDIKRKDKPNSQISWQQKVKSLTFIRYADDFLLIHHDLNVVQRCRELISEWLKDTGLELKPSKTRIAHTLIPEQSEDGQAGFDFLGYHIQQYRVEKYKSAIHASSKEKLGFRTLITPSKSALTIGNMLSSRVRGNLSRLVSDGRGVVVTLTSTLIVCQRLDQDLEVLDFPQSLSGEDLMPGLIVELEEIFKIPQ